MSTKPWKTAIAKATEEETLIRGHELTELIKETNFTQTIFLTLKGEMPTKQEERMLNAILVSSIDHGIAPPSVVATRTVLSGGNSLNTAVGAGVLTLGDAHGGAIEQSAKMLQELVKEHKDLKSFVTDAVQKKLRLAGFGHKVYTTDPRTTTLLGIAREIGFSGSYVTTALALEKTLEEVKGKKLCLNVDGAIAAIISEMGFDYKLGKGFFIIARVVGLVAHAYEEMQEPPVRRLPDELHEYIGKEKRSLQSKF